jgi:D-cysteine desulfhydrase
MHTLKKFIALSLWLYSVQACQQSYEQQSIQAMASYVPIAENVITNLMHAPELADYEETVITKSAHNNALFQAYPALQGRLSYVSLGDFPTPVISCDTLSAELGTAQLYLKHDGLTGPIDAQGYRTYGGNKLRKLQYLLADALAHKQDTVLTFGAAGSNHALQTAVCAQQVGLTAICMLRPQAPSWVVKRNLLMQKAYDAQLHYTEDDRTLHGMLTAALCYLVKEKTGRLPYVIPVGGSCPRGAVGYVEAAFELKKQIDAGNIPLPNRIYVTLGSGGTAAGLLLGLKAVGVPTKVHAVLEMPEAIAGTMEAKLKKLYDDTNQLLRAYDPSFPACTLTKADYEVVTDCGGEGYGIITPQAAEAIELLGRTEGVTLEGTYTGKCFSALVRDVRSGACDNQVVLFWNTFCGEDFSHITSRVDYKELPVILHRYFE